jgi:hypothetical protein
MLGLWIDSSILYHFVCLVEISRINFVQRLALEDCFIDGKQFFDLTFQ